MKTKFSLRIKFAAALFVLIVLSACTKTKENAKLESEPSTVRIEYSNLINGYKVTAIWKPVYVKHGCAYGAAIVEFYNPKDSVKFDVTNGYFAIDIKKLPFSYDKDSLKVVRFNETNITLLYKEMNNKTNENFGNTWEPFFFQDVDFDNVKDLIMEEYGQGQRAGACFRAYKLDEKGQREEQIFNITYVEPFFSLDNNSKIDYANKRIEIVRCCGSCAYETKIYSIDEKESSSYGGNKFFLEFIKQEKYNSDEGKCYEETYRIIDGSKVFESQREIVNN
jgi:hypothetical protein